jgi:hypothetical protein
MSDCPSFQYLFLDYYMAKSLMQLKDHKLRKLRLYDAKEYLIKYLGLAKQLKLLHEGELNKLDRKASTI